MVDYALANQSRTAFRTELNEILEALVSNAIGASAPTTTRPGMLWVDTSGSPTVLRIRNAADSAWVALGALGSSGWEPGTATSVGLALLRAADQAAARTAIGLGAQALVDLAGITFSAGDLLTHTGAALVRLAKGSAGQVLRVKADGTGLEWVAPVEEVVWTWSSNTTSVPFLDLGDFKLIEVEVNLDLASNDNAKIELSPDNGATWRTTGYEGGMADGVGTSSIGSGFFFTRTDVNEAIGHGRIGSFNVASRKTTFAGVFNGGGSRTTSVGVCYDTAEAHNALRVVTSANITGGHIVLRCHR